MMLTAFVNRARTVAGAVILCTVLTLAIRDVFHRRLRTDAPDHAEMNADVTLG